MFVSYTFIVFLAILFVLYYLIPKGGQWAFLLAASCFTDRRTCVISFLSFSHRLPFMGRRGGLDRIDPERGR